MAKNEIEVIARGVILEGSRILLCRNIRGGYFYLPGGHVEYGESAGAAMARELAEETGLSARIGDCRMIHENVFEAQGRTHHEVNIVFHVELETPEAIRSREPDIAFEWVELAALADIDVRPIAVKAWLSSGGSEGSCAWFSTAG